MIDPATSANETAAWSPVGEPQGVDDAVVIDWFNICPVAVSWTANAVFVVLGAIVVVTNWQEFTRPTDYFWIAYGAVAICFALALIVPLVIIRPARASERRIKQVLARAASAAGPRRLSSAQAGDLLAVVLFQAGLGSTKPLSRAPKLPAIIAGLGRYGLTPPRIILDRKIAQQVLAIERPDHLLEPEPVESRTVRNQWLLWLSGLPVVIVIYWFFDPNSVFFGVIIALALIGAARALFWSLRYGVRPGETGLVAGVGYIEGVTGARVGSWQVQTQVTKHSRKKIAVRLLATDWNLEITFASPRDPGFVAFWQRWNHPHPRPELLQQQAHH